MRTTKPIICPSAHVSLRWLTRLALLVSVSSLSTSVFAQGTAFSYQGQLQSGSLAANGNFDLRFAVYNAQSGGNQIAGPLTNPLVAVNNGLFTTRVDFGAGVFTGRVLWLEIGVRTNGIGDFSTLSPRQALTPAPYALFASAAGTATTASNVVLGAVGALNLSTPLTPLPGQVLAYDGTSLAWTNPAAAGAAWLLGGNGGTSPARNFLGTCDNQPLEFKVNSQRVARFEPTTNGAANIIYGANNTVTLGNGVTIGGGAFNTADSMVSSPDFVGALDIDFSTISGGRSNVIAGFGVHSSIGGGFANYIFSEFPAYWFSSTDSASVISGGSFNEVYCAASVIAGGYANQVSLPEADTRAGAAHFIGGGEGNFINYENYYSVIDGGCSNFIDSSYATIAGGKGNHIVWMGPNSGNAVGGGMGNNIKSPNCSTISGGADNSIGAVWPGYGSISGGQSNVITGGYAMIPGGFRNTAEADYSLAAGYRARALHPGAFVWAAGNTNDYISTTTNSFNVYAPGGFLVHYGGQDSDGYGKKFVVLASTMPGRVINVYNGAYLSTGGAWVDNSDRNAKENFATVDTREILARVAELPITSWNYKEDDSVRHIGPVAQDFYASFGVGQDERHIAALDSAGIALAAVQGLNQVIQEKDKEIKELRQTVEELKSVVNTLVRPTNGGGQ